MKIFNLKLSAAVFSIAVSSSTFAFSAQCIGSASDVSTGQILPAVCRIIGGKPTWCSAQVCHNNTHSVVGIKAAVTMTAKPTATCTNHSMISLDGTAKWLVPFPSGVTNVMVRTPNKYGICYQYITYTDGQRMSHWENAS